ncbi:hypothetical protein Bhyg_09224 [Pseudolycoriella hygida]|uniref:Uncharacterized protein n=1 Tax=Pseudolycoriella hygida TaxID=35572 RepID=A0A9Q0N640_9DIPT|nr:hypothetical protein Bhyg_09224 [Pseudolycoriella hygida]
MEVYWIELVVVVLSLSKEFSKMGAKKGRPTNDQIGSDNSSLQRGSVDGAMQKCGLCSLLSRLLRRAMCVGSRRGSGESYYQELAETNRGRSPKVDSKCKNWQLQFWGIRLKKKEHCKDLTEILTKHKSTKAQQVADLGRFNGHYSLNHSIFVKILLLSYSNLTTGDGGTITVMVELSP